MLEYQNLVRLVLEQGRDVQRRNSACRTVAGASMKYYVGPTRFPIVTARRIYYKGVFGELAAMVRGPKCVDDFKKWGCNYWDQFADENGNLNVDYGNAWLEPVNQIKKVRHKLLYSNQDRRLVINGWVPENVDDLSLPCCHFAYQYVAIDSVLHLIWYQRSADVMVGVPSDMVLANAMLIAMAYDTNYEPGTVTMHFGDTHIYDAHIKGAYALLDNGTMPYPNYMVKSDISLLDFTPDMITLQNYEPREFGMKFDCFK